ncbi:MAG: acyl-CoA dehydrogenase, partial [Frankiales bacterium]|nr:acyl-CoA dehydrogenase [Frankiales bacterium]
IAAGVVGPLLAAAGAPLLDRVAVPVAIGSSLLLGPLDAPVAVPAVIDGEERLVLVPAGHATTVVGLDVSRPWSRLGDVALADLPSYTVSFAEWRWRMALVSALDAAGAARGALAGMLEHAQTREQFGVAIGSFQAYKHQCADAYIELKLAQSLAFRAASTGDPRLALAAGLLAPAAARAICGTAVQLMGGIGFTWEGGVHVNLKRALADEVLAGAGARELLAAYAEAR